MTNPPADPFAARSALGPGLPDLYRLAALGGRLDLSRAPVTLKILLENLLRHAGEGIVTPDDVEALARWRPGAGVAHVSGAFFGFFASLLPR
mgnify:CR=1 FL=1